jgi:hypothetical protein
MKTLNIQIDDSLYASLLEMLKKLPKSKIKMDSTNHLNFEQAANYALEKNKELYKRLS